MGSKFLLLLVTGILIFKVAVAQELQLENIHFPGSLGFSQATDNSYGILYRLRGLQDKHTRFLYTTFDSTLQVHHANMLLYKRNNALASSGNANYSAHLFQRVGYDSLKVVIIDKEGRQISKNEFRMSSQAPKLINLHRTENDSLFTFFYKASGKAGNFIVKKVNLQQDVIWEQELTPAAGTITAQFINNKDHIWVICKSKPASRKMAYTVICLDNKTGKILGNIVLHQPNDRREVADITIGPDNELVLIGRHFNKETISRNKPGNFFFTRISPSGERLADFIYNQEHNPNALTALGKTKILWENLKWNPAGHWELIGESFKSTSYLADFTVRMGVAFITLGNGHLGYGKLTTKDLIHVQISPEGQVKKLQVYDLPATKLVLTSWYPAYEFAKIAKAYNTFRFRGIIPDQFSIVVKTKDDIKLLETSPVRTTSLMEINRKAPEEVLGILGHKLLLYSTSTTNQSIQVRRLPLPSTLFSPVKSASSLINP